MTDRRLDHGGLVADGSVTLREEHRGADHRYLRGRLDERGRLHIEGHDLGPLTESITGYGEYEWSQTIAAADVPRVIELLSGGPRECILDLLKRDWTGPRSYELEDRIAASDIPVAFSAWRD